MSDYRRDFETEAAYRQRIAQRYADDEPLTVETDLGKVLDAQPKRPPSPFIVDLGPLYSTPEDNSAITRHENRITELDRRDRW